MVNERADIIMMEISYLMQSTDAGLRRRVVGDSRGRNQRTHGAYVHDVSMVRLDHIRKHFFSQQKRSNEICPDGQLDIVVRPFHDSEAATEPGIVDQDGRMPDVGPDPGTECPDRASVAQIALVVRHARAGWWFPHQGAVVDDDNFRLGIPGKELLHDACPDAAARTRDECDFPVPVPV